MMQTKEAKLHGRQCPSLRHPDDRFLSFHLTLPNRINRDYPQAIFPLLRGTRRSIQNIPRACNRKKIPSFTRAHLRNSP